MNEEIENKSRFYKKKIFASVASILVIVLLITGLAYAWFVRQTDVATLLQISPPSDISILGPDGKEMTSLDLNYTADDKNGDKVTVRRVICVQSAAEKFKLEIVHTTNIKGLDFKLYPVTDAESGSATVTDGEKEFSYLTTPVVGKYLNNAPESNSYKYADQSQHNKNYSSYPSENVQAHAEPIYWLTDQAQNANTSDKDKVTINNGTNSQTYYRTFYVCEVTWTETNKETDIFYILAQAVQG